MTATLTPSAKPLLLDQFGQPLAKALRRVTSNTVLKARYDAAQTTDENAKLWAMADGLSAAAANSPDVRKQLRDRSRYETANNSYASGMVRTLVADVVGTGPQLQATTGDPESDRLIEEEFGDWSEAVRLPEKLRTLRTAQTVDGEAFALLSNNPDHEHPVSLDLKLYEADQLARPWLDFTDPLQTDGIILNDFGDPLAYTLLDQHPGDLGIVGPGLTWQTIRASQMIHLFRRERAGQVRGVPEITPSIPLFAELRRFTLAVIAAAETAADAAGVLQSQSAPGEEDDVEPLDAIDFERRMMLTLPKGWQLNQLKSEQPSTTYAMFKREIIAEIARCLCMPFNVAAGDSSGYNYSSGRLDHKKYAKFIGVARHDLQTVALRSIFAQWWREAEALGIVPSMPRDSIRRIPRHAWRWPGEEHIDPAKEAGAQATKLKSGTTTLAIECAKEGTDWEQVLRQRAKELELMRELGIPTSEPAPVSSTEEDDDEA